jgi:anti-sigma regulatory factor (Ser/Thr protein kinase)
VPPSEPVDTTRPLPATRSLPATPASIAEARHWVTAQARAVGAPPRTVDAVVLATSELVTNAVRHAAGTRAVVVSVRVTDGDLRVEVHDSSASGPQPRPGRAGLPGGHGLHIIDAVSGSWGWRPRPSGGKVVWATFTW